MFDANVKPNNMSFEAALEEMQSLNGITIGTLDGKPTIFFSHNMVAAMEIARYALMQPERQETEQLTLKTPEIVTLYRQCTSCGHACSNNDNFCSHCGRRFKEVIKNGCTKE